MLTPADALAQAAQNVGSTPRVSEALQRAQAAFANRPVPWSQRPLPEMPAYTGGRQYGPAAFAMGPGAFRRGGSLGPFSIRR